MPSVAESVPPSPAAGTTSVTVWTAPVPSAVAFSTALSASVALIPTDEPEPCVSVSEAGQVAAIGASKPAQAASGVAEFRGIGATAWKSAALLSVSPQLVVRRTARAPEVAGAAEVSALLAVP